MLRPLFVPPAHDLLTGSVGSMRSVVPTGRCPARVRADRAPAGVGDGGRLLALDQRSDDPLAAGARPDCRALAPAATPGRGAQGAGLGQRVRGGLVARGPTEADRTVRRVPRDAGPCRATSTPSSPRGWCGPTTVSTAQSGADRLTHPRRPGDGGSATDRYRDRLTLAATDVIDTAPSSRHRHRRSRDQRCHHTSPGIADLSPDVTDDLPHTALRIKVDHQNSVSPPRLQLPDSHPPPSTVLDRPTGCGSAYCLTVSLALSSGPCGDSVIRAGAALTSRRTSAFGRTPESVMRPFLPSKNG